MRQHLQALGRLPAGRMNKTEARYSALLEQRRMAGEVAWWAFEGITLKLAHDCRLTPDFAVMLADGRLELHDVKGSARVFTDDAKAKMRVAARQFPIPIFVATPSRSGGFDVQEIPA